MQHEMGQNAGYGEILNGILEMSEDEQREALERLVEPLTGAPPADQWTDIADTQDGSTVKIPFAQDEAEAIAAAQQAHSELLAVAAAGSGAAREFIVKRALFPRTAEDLVVRNQAAWMIVLTALSTQEVLNQCNGTAWEPWDEEADNFAILRDLPSKLISHPRA